MLEMEILAVSKTGKVKAVPVSGVGMGQEVRGKPASFLRVISLQSTRSMHSHSAPVSCKGRRPF